MNWHKLLLLVVFIPVLGFSQGDKGVRFENDLSWQQVFAKAEKENKYVFIDVFATWCGPCKLMDKKVYPNDSVADFLHEKFISVKAQMDTTADDNQQVKNWYAAARAINDKYHIQGFPSFLFFTPQGELVYRGLGFKEANAFVKMAGLSLDPKRKEDIVLIEKYKQGEKDYSILPDLIKSVRDIQGNETLAVLMAKDYKTNFLEKLNVKELATEDNLKFIVHNANLLSSSDKLFSIFYDRPSFADSILHDNGLSQRFVLFVINKEEIEKKLWKDDKPITKKPDWTKIYNSIAKKYERSYAEKLIPKTKLEFYKRINNWPEFVKLRNEDLKQNPPKPFVDGNLIGQKAWELNVDAFNLFLNCNDKALLSIALNWVDLSLKLCPPDFHQIVDTKANLLYKLGRVKEAISEENKALVLANNNIDAKKEYADIIDKMKKGLPTWKVN